MSKSAQFHDSEITEWLEACREHVSVEALANIQIWLTEEAFADFRADIAAKIREGAWTELDDGFYTVLPFGTGGRRGPRGLGPNRINRRTIAESAKGLADWVAQSQDTSSPSPIIVIARDTRHGSPELSRICAQVIAACGIQAYLFESYRPTPELSFALRHLRAQAGIVVSASHNPPSDNGFKAYGPDGGQLVPPDDAAVLKAVNEVSRKPISFMDFEEGQRTGLIKIIGKEEDEAYLNALSKVTLTTARDVRIVYTPLHGVGAVSVLPALKRAGFHDIHVVAEQSTPDGDFPNVKDHIPNPEMPEALIQAKELAERLNADIAIATDPDADRLGCVAKRTVENRTEWVPLNGNQIGAILCFFALDELQRQNRLRADSLVLRTAVTTELIDRIAAHYSVGIISELLVGFKYIACVLKHLDDPQRIVLATEESHGYLTSPYTRDKDAANAALILAEAAASMKEKGRDLWGLLTAIYRRCGYFSECLENYIREGKTGQQEILAMLDGLRASPPGSIAGLKVLRMVDRLTDEVRDADGRRVGLFEPVCDPKTGKVIKQLTQAKDNLLIFHLAGNDIVDGARIAVRPSGTEPKCKFYVSAHRRLRDDMEESEVEEAKQKVDALTLSLRDSIMNTALKLS
jgi:phosphoglucomutase